MGGQREGKEGERERKKKRNKERKRKRESRRTFCFGRPSTLLYHLPQKFELFFFCDTTWNKAKKSFVISSSHISSIVYIDSFEKETLSKKKRPNHFLYCSQVL